MKWVLSLLLIVLGLWLTQSYQFNKRTVIQTLLRQTTRWAVASEQDLNPLIAILHADYAVGYLSALREIVSDRDIQRYGGIDSNLLMRQVQRVQDVAVQRAVDQCPSFGPKSMFIELSKRIKEQPI